MNEINLTQSLKTTGGSELHRRDFLQLAAGLAASLGFGSPSSASQNTLNKYGDASTERGGIKRFGDGRDWFFEKRFGLFLHWGLYSIDGWHEQMQRRRGVRREEYEKLAQQWNPTQFDPEAWLDVAEATGMKYVCFTTKHHDGFCLWDTKQTTYNTMNTPYGRDVLKMLADACHRRGFPLCLYYSCVDWHHPNYPNQGRHHELPLQPQDQPDLPKYLEFLKAQVRELCSNYGEIGGFWWDMNVPEHVDPSINAMIRQLQPNAVINDRGYDRGDYGTPERDYISKPLERLTEACQSIGMESWGYRVNEDFYTDRHLIRSINYYLARDANYLLNVGPKSDGTISEESAAVLRRIGKWYLSVKESMEDVSPLEELGAVRGAIFTRRGNTIYAHLNPDPVGDSIKLKPLSAAPRRATLLNTGAPVEFELKPVPSDSEPFLRLRKLPTNEQANAVLVVKLEFDELSAGIAPVPSANLKFINT